MATYYEQLLPSGRAVRYEKITPKKSLDIHERVAAEIGDSPDPGHARAQRKFFIETICSCIKAITIAPVEMKYMTGETTEPDIDATLDGVQPHAWASLNHEMLKSEGEFNIYTLFEDMDDFDAVHSYVSAVRRSDKNPFAGKMRIRSS